MLNFLIKNNLLPYIALAVMGYVIYIQHSSGIEKDREIANAKASAEQANVNMNHIIGYTDSRFKKIEDLKNNVWKKGKHEKVIYYDNN